MFEALAVRPQDVRGTAVADAVGVAEIAAVACCCRDIRLTGGPRRTYADTGVE